MNNNRIYKKSPGENSRAHAKVDNLYYWQVALQQSLLPLPDYGWILKIIFKKNTNYFWHHYLFFITFHLNLYV